MHTKLDSDRFGRRRLLSLVTIAGATALAGCAGGSDDGAGESDGDDADGDDEEPSGDGDDGSDDGDDGSDDDDGSEEESSDGDDGSDGSTGDPCDGLDGEWIAFDPGERSFPMHFEHPDTFEEYNADSNEGESAHGAQLGHAEFATSYSYPVNLHVAQNKEAFTGEDETEQWVTSFGNGERIEWTFEYEGEEIDVYRSEVAGEGAAQFRFLVPAHDADGTRGTQVQYVDDREETCPDGMEEISKSIIESMRPNAEYEA